MSILQSSLSGTPCVSAGFTLSRICTGRITCHFLEIQYTRVFHLVIRLYVLRLKFLCVSRIFHAWHITHPSHPLSHASSFLLCFQCNHKYNLLSLNTDFV